MKIWARIFLENRMIKDTVVEDHTDETRTHKVFNSLEKVCREFDLQVPIWLNQNVKDFKRTGKTRFTKDSFIESVDFDYLEFYILEEDY